MLRSERTQVEAREGDDQEEPIRVAQGREIFPGDEFGLGRGWITILQAGL